MEETDVYVCTKKKEILIVRKESNFDKACYEACEDAFTSLDLHNVSKRRLDYETDIIVIDFIKYRCCITPKSSNHEYTFEVRIKRKKIPVVGDHYQ